jgi:hypothetical protein
MVPLIARIDGRAAGYLGSVDSPASGGSQIAGSVAAQRRSAHLLHLSGTGEGQAAAFPQPVDKSS